MAYEWFVAYEKSALYLLVFFLLYMFGPMTEKT